MKRIQLLLFAGSLKAGGTEKHFYQLLTLLNREEFEIHVALYQSDYCNFGKLPSDVNIHVIEPSYIKAAKAIQSVIKTHQIKIVYSCAFETSLPLLINRAIHLNFSYQLITGVRGFFKFPLDRKIIEWFISAASQSILVNSTPAISYIPALFRKKAKLIYNGIDLNNKTNEQKDLIEKYSLDKNARIIGCVARLSHDKGIDLLLRAFQQVLFKNHDYHLILVGDGESKPELEKLCQQLNISTRVHFAGNVQQPESYIKSFHAMVLPSRTESFPNVLLEAIKYRVPFAAAAVGGVPELTERVNSGILFPMGNIAEMADAIEKVMSHQSEFSFEGSEYFSIERMIRQFENEFKRVTNNVFNKEISA
jgi:glycosyltransferase involved in cell wall biosynthesis